MPSLLLAGAGPTGPGASFSPTSVAGLELWLKADAIGGKVDNDPIATWTDSSGAGHDATQATGANQPLYKTNIVNGLPVLRFDGVNDTMGITGWSADASRTLFAVVKNISGAGRLLVGTNGNAALRSTGTAGNWEWATTQAAGTVTIGANSAFAVVTIRSNSAASMDVYFNGGAGTNFDPDDTFSTSAGLTIASDNGIAGWANVDLPELLSYSNALSNTDVDLVRNSLGAKYGLF